MPTEVLVKVGDQFSFADHAGDHAPTGNNIIEIGTPTDVQFAVSGVTDGNARASTKATISATTRPAQFSVDAAIEFFAAPTAGKALNFKWSPSGQSSAAVGNPGKPSGTDGAYAGDGSGELEESLAQMQDLGPFVCTDLIGVQIAHIGVFTPAHGHGILVMENDSGVTVANTNDVQCTVTLTAITDEIAD